MKKIENLSTLFAVVALLMLQEVGSAGAAFPLQVGPGEGEIEPDVEIGPFARDAWPDQTMMSEEPVNFSDPGL